VFHAVRLEDGGEDFGLRKSTTLLLELALHHPHEHVEEERFISLERHEETAREPAHFASHAVVVAEKKRAIPT